MTKGSIPMKRLGTLMTAIALAPMLAALPALAQSANSTAPDPGYGYSPMWGYGHHMWGWGPGYWFHPIGMLFFVAFFVIMVFCVSRLFTHGGRRGYYGFRHGYGRGTSALDILEERFAKGEIDKSEFEEKRKLLMR
jgi:putative membrane protein